MAARARSGLSSSPRSERSGAGPATHEGEIGCMADPLAPLRSLPRLRLAHIPTPLERMPRLGTHLGLDALFVKRDDCTGAGLGGNKIRKLEFDLAAAIASGADCVVCGGVVQSNTARQV